jgi:hypothetical protein
MSPNQIGFFLIISAFIVAAFIVYFELNRDISNFTQKCENDYHCVPDLKCIKGECIKTH